MPDSPTFKHLFRRIANVAGARLVAAVMQAGVIVLLARVLEPAGFGAFAALTAIGALIGVALGFGTTTAALRIRATKAPSKTAANLLIIRAISSIAAVAGTIITGLLVFSNQRTILWFIGIYLLAELMNELLQSLLLGMVAIWRASIVIVSRRLLPFLTALSAFCEAIPTLGAISVGMALSLALSLSLTLRYIGLPTGICRTVRRSVHYWSSTTVVAFQRLDIFLVSTLASSASGGAYAAAQRLTSPAQTLTSSILGIVTPQLSSVAVRSERLKLFRDSRTLVVGLALALTLLSPLAGFLAPYILGADYAGIGLLVTCAVVATGLDGVAQVYASHYYAEGRARQLFYLRLISVPLGLAVVAAVASVGSVSLLPLAILVAPTLGVAFLHLGSTGSRKS